MSKKKWKDIEDNIAQVASEAAETIHQFRGKSGARVRPLEDNEPKRMKARKAREIPPGFADLRRGDPKRVAEHAAVVRELMGLDLIDESLPEDLPAIERIKIYARAGYKQYHVGTDADFERVWDEAFGKESKFKFLRDMRREKGGKK